MIEKILVPTDGSDLSKKAAKKAIELAKGLDAEIIVTNIMDQKATIPYDEQEKRAHEYVQEIIDMAVAEDVKTSSMIIFGSPNYDIMTVTLKSEADMIVIGTHGNTGLKSSILGSFAQATLKNVDLPILLVK
ncbi:universal stress protein [Methanosphaera sp. Vir-13MRS]|jgi:nucleotide-binding universal stress UspA family protein|uniref:universal stress protein n=1 Tax=Candidatus Methanosphaera massiliense TaxID=3017187 RepID=UPI0023807792|nr:universal stress protein [Candidatus Methanosphaera massiliense]MDE4078381.1 universal stress protein [Candidatus Methanosphaera massiliense]MDY2744649.1 universal stress protein [Methanosphaera sp.]